MYKMIEGTGAGEVLEIEGGAVKNLNSYARVTEIDGNRIKLENMALGGYEKFNAGDEIIIHVTASNRVTGEYLGRYDFYKIMLIADGIYTLDKAVFDADLNYEYVQAVTVPNLYSLKLKDAVLTPPPYDPFNFCGGILIVRCYDSFEMENSQIDLINCGIPANRKNALRPLDVQETAANGETDNAKLSGQENFITAEKFIVNAGDGAAMLICRNFKADEKSRIGNPATHGVQRSRGAADSIFKPSNVTNIGGSTILIAAEKMQGFSPALIAKYRSSDLPAGKGLARCYIASNSVLPTDEGLYSYDILANRRRLQGVGIKDFGGGTFGSLSNPNLPLNNYAAVTAISRAGHKFNFKNKTLNGLTAFKAGGRVLVQAIQKSAVEMAGRFIFSRVLECTENYIVTEDALNLDLNHYAAQIISVPEFENFSLNGEYNLAKKYDGESGGVIALAVAETLDLRGGKLNVEGKGGAIPYGRAGLNYIGNAQNFNRLPLGEGHGSVFILAKKLILDENSRIGALYSGEGEGGRYGGSNFEKTNQGGGYAGAVDEDNSGSGGGFIGGGSYGGLGGSGANGGFSSNVVDWSCENGGYGSGKLQGAHLFICADKIENFRISAISTGGDGAISGAASYGGGGGKGVIGGAGAFAFIYSN